jgi:hypothetical protein
MYLLSRGAAQFRHDGPGHEARIQKCSFPDPQGCLISTKLSATGPPIDRETSMRVNLDTWNDALERVNDEHGYPCVSFILTGCDGCGRLAACNEPASTMFAGKAFRKGKFPGGSMKAYFPPRISFSLL